MTSSSINVFFETARETLADYETNFTGVFFFLKT
jgi:hypothetical protein